MSFCWVCKQGLKDLQRQRKKSPTDLTIVIELLYKFKGQMRSGKSGNTELQCPPSTFLMLTNYTLFIQLVSFDFWSAAFSNSIHLSPAVYINCESNSVVSWTASGIGSFFFVTVLNSSQPIPSSSSVILIILQFQKPRRIKGGDEFTRRDKWLNWRKTQTQQSRTLTISLASHCLYNCIRERATPL